MTERDDEAWRAIVENYGERATLDGAPADAPGDTLDPIHDAAPDQEQRDAPDAEPAEAEPDDGEPDDGESGDGESGDGEPAEDPDATIARALAEEQRFVPPPAPPLPYVAPPRLSAGLGVFGAPLVLVVCAVGGFSIPGWLGYLLVASFVGGFAYLVAHMKKRPDDPWDDGARV